MVRTTLTLDDDVAAKLKAEARRSGASLRDVVNAVLRRGLLVPQPRADRPRFRIVARDLGEVAPGISMDNVAELLDRVEGPARR